MKTNRKGFTLIELLVVVLIIGILAAIALPQYTRTVEKSRATEAMLNLKAITDAANRVFLLNNSYDTLTVAGWRDALDIEPANNTPNFDFTVVAGTATDFSAIATRAGRYTITYKVSNGGAPERTCTVVAGATPDMCKGGINALLGK